MIELDNNEKLNDYIESECKSDIQVEDLLEKKITYSTQSMDIETMLNGLKRGDYILPKYQRKYVWEKNQASNLILSLIKNIPIPPVYLYYDKYTGKYTILDGQQRITSIFMYYKNIFYKNTADRKRIDFEDVSLKLESIEMINERLDKYGERFLKSERNAMMAEKKDIEKQLEETYSLRKTDFKLHNKEITFESFNEKTKRILKRKKIEVVFVECNDDNPYSVYTQIFKLLNSAGKELSSQEIRNGVYSKNFLYEYIDEFNENNPTWRKIYGKSDISKDFEYLLRFLALDKYSKYDKESDTLELEEIKNFSLGHMIDLYSEYFNVRHNTNGDIKIDIKNEETQKYAKQEVEKLYKFFSKIKDLEDKVSGGKILIVEAIFVAFSKLGMLDSNNYIEYLSFINSLDLQKDFDIQKSTSNKSTVEKRLNKAIGIVKERYKYERS